MPRKRTVIDPRQVDAYFARCCDRSTPPRVSEFAWELGISRVTLNLRFRETMGTSLSKYFAAKREEEARALLTGSSLKNEDVGMKAGFGTPRNFQRAFTRSLGVSPGRYRAYRNHLSMD